VVFGSLYFDISTTDEFDPLDNTYWTQELEMRLDGAQARDTLGRYWNGYRIPLRLLSQVLDYTGLRILAGTLFAALTAASTWAILRTFGRRIAVFFLGALLLTTVFIVPFTLNMIAPWLIMYIAILLVCYLCKKGKMGSWGIELFFTVGALTAFFDIYTTPVITLGIPLTLVLLWRMRHSALTPKQSCITLIILSAAWTIGYALFWATQLAIASFVIPHINFFENALDAAQGYSYVVTILGGVPQATLKTIASHFATLLGAKTSDTTLTTAELSSAIYIRAALAVGFISMASVLWWLRIRGYAQARTIVKHFSPLLLVALLPFVRTVISSGTSFAHTGMIHRELLVFIFALGVFFIESYRVAREGD